MKTSHELPLRPDATVSSGKRRAIVGERLLARAGRLASQVLNVPALSRASSPSYGYWSINKLGRHGFGRRP
jgi:hypothetical protein